LQQHLIQGGLDLLSSEVQADALVDAVSERHPGVSVNDDARYRGDHAHRLLHDAVEADQAFQVGERELQYAELAMAYLHPLGAMTALDRRKAKATALFLMGGAAELIEAVVSGSLRLSRAQVVDQLTALRVASLSG
jgi:hypothetical protein